MKSVFLAALAAIIVCACAAPAPVTPAETAQLIANVQNVVSKQCTVIQPVLADMTILNQANASALADLSLASTDIGKICALAASPVASGVSVTLSLADVATAVNEGVPKLLTVIAASALPDPQRTAAELAITGAQAVISIALAKAQ